LIGLLDRRIYISNNRLIKIINYWVNRHKIESSTLKKTHTHTLLKSKIETSIGLTY